MDTASNFVVPEARVGRITAPYSNLQSDTLRERERETETETETERETETETEGLPAPRSFRGPRLETICPQLWYRQEAEQRHRRGSLQRNKHISKHAY